MLDLAQVLSEALRSDARQLLRSLAAELYCLLSGPEKERAKDIWQLQVFGLAGKLDFTGITQRWLRESVKWWAAEDLPLRRGREPADSARDTIRAATALSASLRLARDDGGHDPAASAVSRRSLLADNANLRERSRRLEQHARSLEDRLSELLGTQVSQRTGLGPPPDVAALNDQVQALKQENIDLRRRAEEREEELAAAREANRRLMNQINRPCPQ